MVVAAELPVRQEEVLLASEAQDQLIPLSGPGVTETTVRQPRTGVQAAEPEESQQ
jgi:hypothetical protein